MTPQFFGVSAGPGRARTLFRNRELFQPGIDISVEYEINGTDLSAECHSDKRKFEAKQGVKSLAQRAEIEHLVFAS